MVQFRITSIDVPQFAILHENGRLEDFEVEISLDFTAFPTDYILQALPALRLCSGEDSPFLLIQAGCSVQLTEESWVQTIHKTDKSFVIPKDLILHILVIAIGTVRGVLHEKCSNSSYHGIVLPALDLTSLVTEEGLELSE